MTDREVRSIYRFKLSPNIIELIENFSRLHMYSSREVFKEKWKDWLIINREEVNVEKARLKNLGYTKNVESKMYTATRYYFKKKEESLKDVDTSEKDKDLNKGDKNTRGYIVLDEKLVKKMDEFIKDTKNSCSKPSDSYEIFRGMNRIQPPLIFYKNIIESRKWKKIIIISEDKLNPCIDVLLKQYNNIYYFGENTLEKDIYELFKSTNLVMGNGTFIISLSIFMPHLEKLYYSDDYDNDMKYFLDIHQKNKIHYYEYKNYYEQIISLKNKNMNEVKKIMINYIN